MAIQQIEYKGLAELDKAFYELMMVENDPELINAFLNEAKGFKNAIKEEAPIGKKRGGNLKRSVVAKKFRSKGKSVAFVGIDYRVAPHAHLVENGTIHSAPNPFFTRGVNRRISQFGDFIKRYFEKKVKEV